MDKLEVLNAELRKTIKEMNVPKERLNDHMWLMRNLRIKNEKHPQYHKAMSILRDIIMTKI